MASYDAGLLAKAAGALNDVSISGGVSSFSWWLDVETANSWQAGSLGEEMNLAVLQGMAYVFGPARTPIRPNVGVYSTSYQWGEIVGSVSGTFLGALEDVNVWLPGARSEGAAASNCTATAFTGGEITVTQWFSHPFDSDYSCGA